MFRKNVPEVLEIKIEVFSQLDALISPDVILASSTSTIPPSKFTENLKHRSRCLVAHPINPPHIIPAVEVVPSPWTNPDVVSTVRELLISIGQKPIVLKKEINGFIVNRLQYAILGESLRLVQDGIISPADLDTTISYGLATRWSFMGPFQTIDLNAPNGIEDYCNRFLPGISNILKEEDNNVPFGKEVVNTLTEHQRSLYPLSKLSEATKWRDQRLLALAKHHLDQKEKTDSLFPGTSPK